MSHKPPFYLYRNFTDSLVKSISNWTSVAVIWVKEVKKQRENISDNAWVSLWWLIMIFWLIVMVLAVSVDALVLVFPIIAWILGIVSITVLVILDMINMMLYAIVISVVWIV